LTVSQAQDSVHLVSILDSKSLDLAFNRAQSSINLANISYLPKELGLRSDANSQAQKNGFNKYVTSKAFESTTTKF